MISDLENEDICKIANLPYNWGKLKNKKLLISGGTGFLGQFLIKVIRYRNENFKDNIKVLSLSRRTIQNEENITYISQDISKPFDLAEKVDFVLHFASNTHPKQYSSEPVETITTNIFGCNNLLSVANKCKARFLLASSVEIYGNGNGTPMTENYCGAIDCNTARAGYNEAKRLSESLCQSYRSQYGTEAVIIRLARCFGADRKNDSKAIHQFLSCALNGNDIILKSEGKQRFSYCYVADAVSGILKVLMDGEDGEAYNVSDDDEGKTLGDYAALIASFANKKVVFDLTGEKGASTAQYAVLNCDKIKSLGFKPVYNVSEALKRTYDILRDK